MKDADSLSADQILSILDNSPTAIVVSALDNWELLYANNSAKKVIAKENRKGHITCYQAFGYEDPCPACPNGQISRDELFTRELYFPEVKQAYQLSGKIIDWNGRPAHIEYIWNVSEQRRLEKELTDTSEKMQGIINAIPGGVAIYKISDIFETVYFSDGVPELTGYTTEEYRELTKGQRSQNDLSGRYRDGGQQRA